MAADMLRRCLVLLCLSASSLRYATACTSLAMGRKATADGSVIVSQSEDGDDLADPRILYVPARDYPPGAMAPVYYTDGPFPRWVSKDLGRGYEPNKETGPNVTAPIGYIPQVAHTFAYWDSNYAIINEHNVGIGESTCSAMFHTCAKGDTRGCEAGRTAGEAILDSRMLTSFALERATTARQAIEIMGSLAYEYGFYGTHDPNGDGESLMVGDATEAWVFHILADPTGTKALWAARRVPDDSFTVVSNMFTIREVDVTDTENCLASPNIYSVAEERGWWKQGEPLDFTKVYSNGEYGSQYYAGRRMWRALSLAAPSLQLPAEYHDLRYDRGWPWAVKPDQLLKRQDIFNIYRDWYAGTKFDMTKGLAAGFGGTPDRFDTGSEVKGAWERTIALYRTNAIKLVQLHSVTADLPRAMAGVAWVAPGPGHYTPFLPIPSGMDTPLRSLSDITPLHFSKNAFNWQARRVMMTAQIRFDHMHPLVAAKQEEVEAAAEAALNAAREMLVHVPAEYLKYSHWTKGIVEHTKKALDIWQQLPDDMLIRFADNSDISRISKQPNTPVGGGGWDENTASLSYPAWWLRAVGYNKGPPPIPVETQCPPMCPGADSAQQLLEEGERTRSSMLVLALSSVSFFIVFGFVKRLSSSCSTKDTATSPYTLL